MDERSNQDSTTASSPSERLQARLQQRRNNGSLVSRRLQMYEEKLGNTARKGYNHRSQDSFHTPQQATTTAQEESRDEQDGGASLPSSPVIDKQQQKLTTAVNKPNESSPSRLAKTESNARPTKTESPLMAQSPETNLAAPRPRSSEYAGSTLIESGVECYNQGEYEKALKAFKTALKMQRVSVGDDDMCIALTLGNLGSVYLQQNNLEEAERVLVESLEIKKRLEPKDSAADTLNNLGNCANLRGDIEDSLIFYEEALEDVRSKKGSKADEINALFNIGRLEIQRQHWTKAMKALNEACCQAREHCGTNHVSVAQALDLMGFVQLSTSMLDSAMVSFTGAMAIYRRLYGPLHLEVANALFNVGMVREAKGDLQDAWEAFTTARDLYSRLGTEEGHPGYKTVCRSIANVEKSLVEEANEQERRAKEGLRNGFAKTAAP